MLNNICNIHTHIHTKKNHIEFSICMFGWTLNEAVAFKCPKAGNYNPSDYPFRHYCTEWKCMCIHGCRGNRHVVHATNFGQNATTAQKTKSGKLNWTALNQFYPPMPYNRISFWNAPLCLCIHTHANTCDVSECWLCKRVSYRHTIGKPSLNVGYILPWGMNSLDVVAKHRGTFWNDEILWNF